MYSYFQFHAVMINFSSNFQKLVREKIKQTLTFTKNAYHVLTNESDSDVKDDIGKIVRKRKNGRYTSSHST